MSPFPEAQVHRSDVQARLRYQTHAQSTEDVVAWDVVSSTFADNSVDFRYS